MYKVEYEDLSTQVYRAVKNMIISGELKSGEKLVQEDLAARLGVSRTPLLSAYSKLEQENLVETVPRRGAYVKRYSVAELLNLYDIRMHLEPLGARRAAEHATGEEIQALEELLGEFQGAIENGDSSALKQIDFRFHMEIMRASRNTMLYDMMNTFSIIIVANIKGLLKEPEKSYAEHRTLLDAIKRHDSESAGATMFEHISDARHNLEDQVHEHVARGEDENAPY